MFFYLPNVCFFNFFLILQLIVNYVQNNHKHIQV